MSHGSVSQTPAATQILSLISFDWMFCHFARGGLHRARFTVFFKSGIISIQEARFAGLKLQAS